MPDTAEFDDLVAELMLDRPQIDPVFARELDARAAAGFPRRRRRFHLPRPVFYVGAPALAALAIAVVVVNSGSGDPRDTSSGSSAAPQSVAAAPATIGAIGNAGSSGGSAAAAATPGTRALAPSADAAAAPATSLPLQQSAKSEAYSATGTAISPLQKDGRLARPTTNRVQEQSASITLEAPARSVASVGDQILQVTNEVGGFVESSSVRSTDGSDGGGTFSLRIPADRLGDGLARLSRLGHVTERTQGVQDITSLRNVARERLQESTALRTSLLKRLAAAKTDAEVASLKAQIADVNAQIGAARGDLAQVERRASFAQVSVTLTTSSKGAVTPVKDHKWGPKDALRDAGRVLETIASVLVVALSVLVPLALLIAIVVITRRYAGKRGRARALDAI